VQGLAHKGKTEMEFNSDIMKRGGLAPVQFIKASYRLTEGREEEGSLQGQKMSLHNSSASSLNKVLATIPIPMHCGSEKVPFPFPFYQSSISVPW
jgi:hypothetical protein